MINVFYSANHHFMHYLLMAFLTGQNRNCVESDSSFSSVLICKNTSLKYTFSNYSDEQARKWMTVPCLTFECEQASLANCKPSDMAGVSEVVLHRCPNSVLCIKFSHWPLEQRVIHRLCWGNWCKLVKVMFGAKTTDIWTASMRKQSSWEKHSLVVNAGSGDDS